MVSYSITEHTTVLKAFFYSIIQSEKLRLALTRSCNGLQRTKDISHRRTGEELSFRSISHLCYTTLRIHELQVNDLLSKKCYKILHRHSYFYATFQLLQINQKNW